MIHPRGYAIGYDFVYPQFMETQGAIMHCKSTQAFVDIYKYYGERLTDDQIAFTMIFMAEHKLPREPGFWEVIFPKVKELVKNVDRNAKDSLFNIIYAMGHL